MADLGIAVVGAGVHGSRYADHLLRGDVAGARLAGVCRRTVSEAGRWRSRGARFETDFRALLDDPAVDAVVVASPPTLHEEHAVAALSRGKPLILEKPVAPDTAGCDRIRAAASKAGVPVLVGHSHRFNEAVTAARGALRAAGPLIGLHLAQAHPRAPISWQFERPGGGALLCLGVHLADLARWLTGEELAVESCDRRDLRGEVEGSVRVLARTASGVPVEMEASIVAPARQGRIVARGTDYGVEADLLGTSVVLTGTDPPCPIPGLEAGPGLPPLVEEFVAAVRLGARWRRRHAATLDDGIAAVAFVESCHSPR